MKLQNQLQQEVEKLNDVKEKYRSSMQAYTLLTLQQHENEHVLQELEIMEPDAMLQKLVGSVMIPETCETALSVVSKRLDYIKGEMQRVEKTMNTYSQKSNEISSKIQELERQIMETQKKTSQTS